MDEVKQKRWASAFWNGDFYLIETWSGYRRSGLDPKGKQHTLEPGASVTGGTRPWQPGDRAPPGSRVGANGIYGRPNSTGGWNIEIPANGARPHESLHY